MKGCALLSISNISAAINLLTSGMTALHSTGATLYVPWYSSNLARAYAEIGQVDEAWRISEAMTTMQTSEERWCEAEVNRIAGEIALKSRKPDAESRRISSAHSPLRVNSKPSPGNSAPP